MKSSRQRFSLHHPYTAVFGAVLLGIAHSQAGAMSGEDFSACVADLKEHARQQGISTEVVEESLADIEFRERVIALDRQQPEFTESFGRYLEQRVDERRVRQGRRLLSEHRALLEDIAHEYGVPPQYLVAFWGLETNYGGFFGRMPVLDSLATLACDERRSTYFTGELMDALRVIEEGAITPKRMEGSWAGAMGHMQFMPSVFLRYAVDRDGSGRRDLWGSIPDAMASAANFLSGIGWESGARWGREVRLPEGFPYEVAGRDRPRPLSDWARLGVTRANGDRLPDADVQAALLVPSGHRGPAFLVYDNFNVIMRWNRSEFYALAVGHLADRINGAGGLHEPPPDTPRLSTDEVRTLQRALNERGYDSGDVDGVFGPATRRALSEFQKDAGLVADGFAGEETLGHLDINSGD